MITQHPSNSSALPPEISSLIRRQRPAIAALAAASCIINLLMLVGPIFMLQIYDRVLPSRSLATLTGLFAIVLVLYVIQAYVDAIRSRLLARLAEAYDLALRDPVFDAVRHIGLRAPSSDGQQPIRDLDTVRGFIAGQGLIAACDLPWTPIYVLACFLFHPWLGAAVCGGAVILCGLSCVAEIVTRKPTAELISDQSARRMTSDTAFRHAEAVAALGMQRRIADIWSSQSSRYLDTQRYLSDLSGGFGSASRFCRMVLQSATLAIGALLVINQQATAGVMLAATILSIRALSPIELALANWRGFIAARASLQRTSYVLRARPAARPPTRLPDPQSSLTVTAISIAVPETGAVVLHDVSFALQAGQAVAVMGASGSGKSTLARALVGAWPTARGVIRIDGAALGQWDADTLGRWIGFIPQDVALFKGTVAQNVSRFAEHPDSSRIVDCARAAGVHQMILRLPQGYETEVGDGGLSLSGGQRQRIALARALFDNPFLIVLDEPNSNLDAEGEQALARAILAARARGAIVVVISHRPAVLSAVDHILILNEGRMRAFGKADTILPLIAKQPVAAADAAAPPASRKRATSGRRADAAE